MSEFCSADDVVTTSQFVQNTYYNEKTIYIYNTSE